MRFREPAASPLNGSLISDFGAAGEPLRDTIADYHQQPFAAFCRERPPWISLEQRQSLLNLSPDLADVWFAPTTPWMERKDLLKLLVADGHDMGIIAQIRWFTNQAETGELPPPSDMTPQLLQLSWNVFRV